MAAASLSATFSAFSVHSLRREPSISSSHRLRPLTSKPPFSLLAKAPHKPSPPRATPPISKPHSSNATNPKKPIHSARRRRQRASSRRRHSNEIARAFEEIYGPAYSGETFLGNDVHVMDSTVKKMTGFGSKTEKKKFRDRFDERVVQVRRITKVVKGGKQMHFRAVVVVGNKQGNVGVGVGMAKEVVAAVQKSAINARRNSIMVS